MIPATSSRWQRFSSASVSGFHTYANWLVGISWRRFIVLSLLLLIVAALLQEVPPFRWTYTRTVSDGDADTPAVVVKTPPKPVVPPVPPTPRSGKAASEPAAGQHDGVQITIDERGVRITPTPAASAASAGSVVMAPPVADGEPVIDIRLPPGPVAEGVREAVTEARQAIADAVREAREEAQADAARAEPSAPHPRRKEVHRISLGEFLPQLALLWIFASAIVKITYKRQIQAEAQAAQAVETAEAESLKRQVLEARMAAMQAQVEPHFLFNTLASIDHLIEVDAKRASQMQKNLIALLRASMPTMRDTGDSSNGGRSRDLGRELAVIRPYLEILKVRMEERLTTEIDVPDGLLSAEFPPMMVQTLVENAIKHGLEPKPEGGKLTLRAEIVHGKLAVTVADTGLGFGRAATAGTGVGLANIRERLKLLYGHKAAITITENPGGGTRVTLSVPYKPLEGGAA